MRVTLLKAEYEVRKSMASEDDADELATCHQIALDCSSAQRELTRELQHYRDSVNNNGGLFNSRTSRPRSNMDFMQLQLIAQREGNELSQVRNEELRAAREQTERVRIHDNYYILDADCAVTAESWHATVACCRLGTIWRLFINLLAYSCGISTQLMCSSCGTIFGLVFVNLLAIFSSVFVVLLAVFGLVFVVLLAIFGLVFVVLLAVFGLVFVVLLAIFGSVFVDLLAIFGSVFVDLLAIFGSVFVDLLAIFHGARIALA
ncbi:hypothetical protein K490DRAFT_58707 [Saccharata proteae CBS 121410]|uniref:Uncharacterized protein n=1 Tax=Saccharata proteae CBS 121410 TaxID=1314787 RepID=A0A9P4HRG9_9PEZI|nr:hypothetical protein K490DRAFT_58707 [Saccharata proteae CBS 121410]